MGGRPSYLNNSIRSSGRARSADDMSQSALTATSPSLEPQSALAPDVLSRRAGATGIDCRGMEPKWETIDSGPAGAEQTVLLLPGGMCSARSFAEVMAEPTLARTRLLAVTMPGHAGAPAPDDFSTESYARITAELAKSAGVDVVVGFSMGAMVAYELVVSGAFAGPVVLLGASLSTADEPGFFRAMIRLGSILGTVPAAVLKKGVPS